MFTLATLRAREAAAAASATAPSLREWQAARAAASAAVCRCRRSAMTPPDVDGQARDAEQDDDADGDEHEDLPPRLDGARHQLITMAASARISNSPFPSESRIASRSGIDDRLVVGELDPDQASLPGVDGAVRGRIGRGGALGAGRRPTRAQGDLDVAVLPQVVQPVAVEVDATGAWRARRELRTGGAQEPERRRGGLHRTRCTSSCPRWRSRSMRCSGRSSPRELPRGQRW